MKLKVIGRQRVSNFEFTGIEGGFGEGKKAVLVREIAVLHEKELRAINQNIDRNIERFEFGVDIINLLESQKFEITVSDLGLRTSNSQKSAYLLSERGYLKLVKIMDDEKSWEVYNHLLGEYFRMKKEIKTIKKALVDKTPMEILNDNGVALNSFFGNLGLNIPKEIVAHTAIVSTTNMTGYAFDEVKLLLNKQEEEQYHSASGLLKRLNIKVNKTNMTLLELGLQIEGTTSMQKYVLTELGKRYGVERSYTSNGHQGYEIKWKESLLDYIKENLDRIPTDWVK